MNICLDLPACFARVKRWLKMDLAIITRSTAAIIRSTGSSKNMETCGHKTAFWCFLHFLHCRDDRHYTIYKSLEGPFVPIEFLTNKQTSQGRSAVDVARDSNHMDLLVEMQQKAWEFLDVTSSGLIPDKDGFLSVFWRGVFLQEKDRVF